MEPMPSLCDQDKMSEYHKKDGDECDKMIEFLCTTGRLKTLSRRGWILPGRDIPNPESIAGHMYRMGVISMLFDDDDDGGESSNLVNGECFNHLNAGDSNVSKVPNDSDQKLDVSKLVKMSLVHDIAECMVGDITPFDGISEDEKHQREMKAMQHLVSLLPSGSSKKMLSVYEEYEKRESLESKIVKELDRFDVMLQAFQYERSEYDRVKRIIRFDEFFQIAVKHIHHPRLRSMVDRIIAERDKFFAQIGSQETNKNTAN